MITHVSSESVFESVKIDGQSISIESVAAQKMICVATCFFDSEKNEVMCEQKIGVE